jgi:uncharacterized integral membrane protein
MRLLVILLTILLFVNILGFVLTNLDTRIEVTVWKTQYRDVSLFAVVILSVLAGILYAGVIAVAEGANLRIENRRLHREIQKLETELVYLRTERPRARPGEAETSGEGAGAAARAEAERPETADAPASAPVYDTSGYGWDDDPGDGAYTGGRGV